MGCTHSSSPPNSPKLLLKTGKRKLSRKYSTINFEQILDGHGQYLLKRLEFNSPCLLFDASSTHILLLNNKQLDLIHINTMNINRFNLPNYDLDIQEIVWSTYLHSFLILTTDRLYQTDINELKLKPIQQIQFINEGHRKSYMTINDDDLIINRSFGNDLRRYSLSNYKRKPLPNIDKGLCITNIQLNSKKILALSISIRSKQMIDLINLNTNEYIHRIKLDKNENILYPIDLHINGIWFAKTCIPYVNIGHCLISSNGEVTRLKLFSTQDNFIRSIKLSYDNRYILIARQYALEIYSLTTRYRS